MIIPIRCFTCGKVSEDLYFLPGKRLHPTTILNFSINSFNYYFCEEKEDFVNYPQNP